MTSPIHHIETTVSNMQTSADFYGALLRMLGWTELRRGMFLRDGCELYLKEAKVDGAAAHVGPRNICFRAGYPPPARAGRRPRARTSPIIGSIEGP